MKITLFILLFLASLTISAQTAETLSELSPVPSNIGKFTKNVPKYEDRISDIRYKVKFDVKTEFVNLPDGKKAFAIIVEMRPRELFFELIGGRWTARLNIYGRITAKDKMTDGFFEEKIDAEASVEELSGVSKMKPVFLRKIFALPAGKYQIGVIVRDRTTGMRGVKIVKFRIP